MSHEHIGLLVDDTSENPQSFNINQTRTETSTGSTCIPGPAFSHSVDMIVEEEKD